MVSGMNDRVCCGGFVLPIVGAVCCLVLRAAEPQEPHSAELKGSSAVGDLTDTASVLPDDNPFARPSPLAFQAPPFDRIRLEHFQPALMAGMKQQLREIEQITQQPAEPTFENTIVPLERSGQLLSRTRRVFFHLTAAHTSDALQTIQTEMAPLLAAHTDRILLNGPLFERIEAVWQTRDRAGFSEEQKEVLQRHYDDFVRAGAKLSEQQQNRIRVLNERLSVLETQFSENLLEATRERAVFVQDAAELDGLSDGERAAAAERAREHGHDGGYLLEISNTTRVPILTSLHNRDLRRRVWEASANRAVGENGGVDNRPLVLEIARLRAERAQLLGYENFAAWKLQNQMAGTPEAARRMLTDLVPAVRDRVRQEAEQLQAQMAADGVPDELRPWDWEYYAEKVRRRKFRIDEARLRSYFEFDSVLRNGVFHTMERLFGIRFEERFDLPVYHRDVRVFDVTDADGEALGLFYVDVFRRDSKRGGAWMSAWVSQSRLLQTRPVVVNVLNNPRPADGQPALISLDNVTTMFHEMGHAVHGLFSDVMYPSVSGTATPRDFVEFPSTFEEDWCIRPDILRNYARHYETGEPLPDDLLQKLLDARRFNQGFETLEYLAAAILDLEWHSLTPDAVPDDVAAFEQAVLKKYGVDVPAVPPRYRTPYFAHIWGGGYAAGYYAYLWSEVLAADAFAWMQKHGGATRANGDVFRREILSRGNSRDPMTSWQAFRGAPPAVDALLIRRGLNSE